MLLLKMILLLIAATLSLFLLRATLVVLFVDIQPELLLLVGALFGSALTILAMYIIERHEGDDKIQQTFDHD